MPGCLHKNLSPFSRKINLTVLTLLVPLLFHAQTLTGLWIGSVQSDSASVRQDQSFEIALTEYRGKVYGYSRNEFIVDDVLYYIVKRVKGTIEGNVCEVTDDDVISHNFPTRPDKNVRVTSIFRKTEADSIWRLDGTWKTNVTKRLYSLSGKITLAEEKDLTASKIFPHLEELKLANDVAFYKDRNEGQPVLKIAKAEPVAASYVSSIAVNTSSAETMTIQNKPSILPQSLPKENAVAVTDKPSTQNESSANISPAQPDVKQELIAVNKITENQPKTPVKKIGSETTNVTASSNTASHSIKPVTIPNKIENEVTTQQAVVKKNSASNLDEKKLDESSSQNKNNQAEKKVNPPVIAQNKIQTNAPATTSVKDQATVTKSKSNVIEISGTNDKKTSTPLPEKSVPVATVVSAPLAKIETKPSLDVTLKAAIVEGRKSEFSQQVNFKSDSLQIALYDNGEIDGDTVSIYMNGEVIMARQGLKSSAIHKTIYIRPGVDEEFTLVLFAVNLGKYPPNTGLLVVRDGDDIYNLRFSSDFQKNAGIVFKRKR